MRPARWCFSRRPAGRACSVSLHVSSSEVYGTARQVRHGRKAIRHCRKPSMAHRNWLVRVTRAPTVTRTASRRSSCGRSTISGPVAITRGTAGEVIPRFIVWALNGRAPVIFGDGTQTRDFLYVEDTAYWLIRAAECDDLVGQTINLGSGEETSIRHFGRNGLRRSRHDADSLPNSSLAVRATCSGIGPTFRSPASGSAFCPVSRLAEGISSNSPLFRRTARDTPPRLLDQMPTVNWTAAAPRRDRRSRPFGTARGIVADSHHDSLSRP